MTKEIRNRVFGAFLFAVAIGTMAWLNVPDKRVERTFIYAGMAFVVAYMKGF